MEIRFVRHEHINRTSWDLCIAKSSNGMVYGESWFLDLVSPGWHGLVAGDYEAVFPLTHRKKLGFEYLYQPVFTQQTGVFGAEDATPFLLSIPPSYRLIEIQLNAGNRASTDGFILQSKPNLVLDLSATYESLYSGYAENTRRNIRKAAKHEIAIDDTTGPQEIIRLFRSHRGRNLRQLTDRDYETLVRICETAGKMNRVRIIGAKTATSVLSAGAIFLRSQHGWIFLFSGTDEEARQTGAMSAVIDHFVKDHAGQRTLLDFEGSEDPNLHRFYKSFGSKEIVYLQIKKNRLPFPLRLLKS